MKTIIRVYPTYTRAKTAFQADQNRDDVKSKNEASLIITFSNGEVVYYRNREDEIRGMRYDVLKHYE